MKISKPIILFIVFSLCAPWGYAQKQVRLPKALGNKSVATVRQGAVPKNRMPKRTPDEVVLRVGTFIESSGRFPSYNTLDKAERSLRKAFDKASSKAIAQQLNDETSRKLLALKEQWIKEKAAAKTPQEVLEKVEKFIATNGRFPAYNTGDEAERALRFAFDDACKKAKNLTDDTSRQLLALKEQWVKEVSVAKTPQEVLAQVKTFVEENGHFPAYNAESEAERLLRLAFDNAVRKVEVQNLTDDTSRSLRALKEQWVQEKADHRTAQEVLAQVETFIEETGRFPSQTAQDASERSLRKAFTRVCAKAEKENLRDETSLKLLALKKEWVRGYTK